MFGTRDSDPVRHVETPIFFELPRQIISSSSTPRCMPRPWWCSLAPPSVLRTGDCGADTSAKQPIRILTQSLVPVTTVHCQRTQRLNSTGRVAGERVTVQRSEKVPFRLVDWSSSDPPPPCELISSVPSSLRHALQNQVCLERW